MKPLIRFSLFTLNLFTLSLLLTACGLNPLIDKTKDPQTTSPPVKPGELFENREVRDFDIKKDTLYDLLVAEIAAQRDQFTITLLNYIQQARMTRDVEIVKRAINAAQLTKDVEAIHEMAVLWLDIEPNSIPAHQLLALQFSLQKQYAEAISHIDAILALGGDARVESLAIGSQSLNDTDKQTLSNLYQKLHEKYPNNVEVTYSYALIQRNLKLYDKSLEVIDTALKKSPDYEPAIVLRANIIYDQGRLKDAIKYADEKFDEFPKNYNLGRLYASMLIEDRQLDKAESVFNTLMLEYPQAPSLKLSHALVMLENHKINEAKAEFLQLLKMGAHKNEAYFYLGRIADNEGNLEEAVNNYDKVTNSIHFEPATERSNFLLAKEGKVDEMIGRLTKLREAIPNLSLKLWQLQFKLLTAFNHPKLAKQTLDNALIKFPEDEQFLYIRAMNYESEDDLVAMERDLKHIIKNDPKNSIAINALGYTLADRTDRLDEAFNLVKQALEITPKNPAILDSMGWVLFKLNKREEALIYLLEAFRNYQDGEVAAHLGEVLWSLNQKTEARNVWANVLLKNPNHKTLLKTIKRIDPTLLDAQDKPIMKMNSTKKDDSTSVKTEPKDKAINDNEKLNTEKSGSDN